MNLRHLEFIIAVGEHKSFTRAAEAMHVSQPSLSHAVTGVEEQIGAQLFRRHSRSVSLTPAGEAFVEAARLVLRDLAILSASVEAVSGLNAGHLDVAAPQSCAAEALAQLVGAFRSEYPGISVRIQTSDNPQEIERFVRTGQCELALTIQDVAPPLLCEIIGEQENLVVFQRGTKLKQRPVKQVDLAGMPIVMPTGVYQLYGGIALQIPTSRQAPFVAVETASRQALIPLVLAGAGITFLPRSLAEGAAAQGLIIAELDPPLKQEIRLIMRDDPLSPAAQAFVRLARGVDR